MTEEEVKQVAKLFYDAGVNTSRMRGDEHEIKMTFFDMWQDIKKKFIKK